MAEKLKAAAAAMKAAAKLSKNKSETVKVCVRVRPLSSKEKQDGREMYVTVSI
jgi:citrate lyase beta subunit